MYQVVINMYTGLSIRGVPVLVTDINMYTGLSIRGGTSLCNRHKYVHRPFNKGRYQVVINMYTGLSIRGSTR